MLEGAVTFAAAAVRRLEHDRRGVLSYPFAVAQVGAGYGSSARNDEADSRAEMWMPIWEGPATAGEIQALLAEGRARVGFRPARNGLDFARAVAGLGVDRGVTEFQRYGFQVRNGLAYFATPLGRYPVRHRPRVGLLQEVDSWLGRFRSRASGRGAPASVGRALRCLEEEILALCRHGDALRLQAVLIALGVCQRALGRSLSWTTDAKFRLSPVPALSPAWLEHANDGSVEFRLAAAFASVGGSYGEGGRGRSIFVPLRCQMEPVRTWVKGGSLRTAWHPEAGRDVVWEGGSLLDSLNAVLARRAIMAVASGAHGWPDRGRLFADPGDMADFIEGRTDDRRLEDLLWGCILLDWPLLKGCPLASRPGRWSPSPGALYSLLKLCYAGAPVRETEIPLVPRLHRLAAAGDGAEASRLASRRLQSCGLPTAAAQVSLHGRATSRAAAALLLPLNSSDLETLARKVLRPREQAEPPGSASTAQEGVIP